MIVLAIDTATPQVSVALDGPDGPRGAVVVNAGRRHAETLAPAIAHLTEMAALPLAGVDLVAVDVGPGLFTGLRVGVATAKALAAALDVPVVGVTSLDLLARAWRAGRPATGPVAAVVDARRAEVFWARYCPGDDAPVTVPAVEPPEVVAEKLAEWGDDVVAVGDGARRYADILTGAPGGAVSVAGAEWAHPDARTLAGAAREAAGRGATLAAADLHPLYLRQADVRIGWEERRTPAGVGRV